MWRSQIEMHRSRHLGAPVERYVDAAMQMRAKALDSGRPFNLSSGWRWFEAAWRSLADDQHEARRRQIAAVPSAPRHRTAAELLAEQERIWSAPA
jgi:hypothetical protein